MSDNYHFGLGQGLMRKKEIKRRDRIAQKHDAEFTCTSGGSSGQCVCGHGCDMYKCKVKRWYFTTRNYGFPFNENVARKVMEEVSQKKI